MMLQKMRAFGLLMALCIGHALEAKAQLPMASIIASVIERAVNALDLALEREQARTIWMQGIQRELENEMSKAQLERIRGWALKQWKLNHDYYQELFQVKAIIAGYDKIKAIAQIEGRILETSQSDWRSFQIDKKLNDLEQHRLSSVYAGILESSLNQLNQVLLVVSPGATQMSDGQRIKIINQSAEGVERNYDALRQVHAEAVYLCLQREREQGEIISLRNLYGRP